MFKSVVYAQIPIAVITGAVWEINPKLVALSPLTLRQVTFSSWVLELGW